MSTDQQGVKERFSADHQRCDAIWAEVEQAITAGDETAARSAWSRFRAAMEHHFSMEEEVLFPELEAVTGMRDAGPTVVMRAEHEQMRRLMVLMDKDAEAGAFDELVDQGDTLLMLTQQHNLKEEGVLYPMADQALRTRWSAIVERLEGIK